MQLPDAALSSSPEAVLLKRCATGMPDVLLGNADPLPLLFPTDGSAGAADVYRDSDGGRALNELVADVFADIVEALPMGRGIRVLEIGAGTGSTTAAVLPILPSNRTQYTFTDITPGFFTHARQTFSGASFIDYRVLDIEKSLDEQSWSDDAHRFDVILAANVLHATGDIDATLNNVRKLLHKDGVLVIVEGTRPTGWLDLTFGLTPGWWSWKDAHRSYPLMSADDWRVRLEHAGLNSFQSLSPTEQAANFVDAAAVMVSQPNRPNPVTTSLDQKDAIGREIDWLVIGDGETLSSQLRDAGQRVEFTSSLSKEAVSKCLEDKRPNSVALVISSGLDFNDTRPSEFAASWLQVIQALLEPREEAFPKRLAWIVDHDDDSGVAGLMRTVDLERPDLNCIGIHVGNDDTAMVTDELVSLPAHSMEVSFEDGVRRVRQLTPMTEPMESAISHRELVVSKRGQLSNVAIAWQPRQELRAGQVRIAIEISGLNFRDVLNVLGNYPGSPPPGAECVGIVREVAANVRQVTIGQRVAAVTTGCIADEVVVNANQTCRVPDTLSAAEAATIPVAYLTASIALEYFGRVRSGDWVLIHSAAGGVGLAAVQLAQAAGANVLATASASKHDLLRQRGVKHIFDSRRRTFATEVMEVTGKRGADIILNSLGADAVDANIASLSKQGRYVDIAIADPSLRSRVQAVHPGAQVHAFDLSRFLADSPTSVSEHLQSVFSRIESGQFAPLPYRVFDLNQSVDALRTLRGGRTTGKVIIKCGQHAKRDPRHAKPAITSSKDVSTEVITGGTGGLGLLLSRWLVEQGSSRIDLLARRSPSDSQLEGIAILQRRGCDIRVHNVDVAERDALSSTLNAIRDECSIKGVFHLAGSLSDAVLSEQTAEHFHKAIAPKAFAARHLHNLTLNDPVQRFVLFSSASGCLGSPGQANHAAANDAIDAIARKRQRDGLPALSIQWGPWSRVGAARNRDQIGRGVLSGLSMIAPEEGMTLFQQLMQANANTLPPVVAAVPLQINALPTSLIERTLFDQLRFVEPALQTSQAVTEDSLLDQLATLPADDRPDVMRSHLQVLVATSLGIENSDSVPVDVPLFELGLDSLTSMELVNALQSSLGITLSSVELFNHPDIAALSDRLLNLTSEQVDRVENEGKEFKTPELSDDSASLASQDDFPIQSGDDDQEIDAEGELVVGGRPEWVSLLNDIQDLTQQWNRWETTR
ncbi:MAG: KR domain-containing protein [Planctomycetota bacterium]